MFKIVNNIPQNTQHGQSSVNNAVKKHFLVPNGRAVKDFVGREDVLELIGKAFSTESTKSKTVVIRGLGGQGKTQIALEHCRRAEKTGVEAVFWVDAYSESSAKKSFQTISGEIKRPGDDIAEENAVSYALKILKDWAKSYIIVFDNYDDVAASIPSKTLYQTATMLVLSLPADTRNLRS